MWGRTTQGVNSFGSGAEDCCNARPGLQGTMCDGRVAVLWLKLSAVAVRLWLVHNKMLLPCPNYCCASRSKASSKPRTALNNFQQGCQHVSTKGSSAAQLSTISTDTA